MASPAFASRRASTKVAEVPKLSGNHNTSCCASACPLASGSVLSCALGGEGCSGAWPSAHAPAISASSASLTASAPPWVRAESAPSQFLHWVLGFKVQDLGESRSCAETYKDLQRPLMYSDARVSHGPCLDLPRILEITNAHMSMQHACAHARTYSHNQKERGCGGWVGDE